jgi:hypothetical protein
MRGGMWWLSGPEDLLTWSEMLGHTEPARVRAEDPAEEILSSDLVSFFSYGDDRSDLFDIRPGPAGAVVRAWGDGELYAGPGERFWDWFDEKPPLILMFPREDD